MSDESAVAAGNRVEIGGRAIFSLEAGAGSPLLLVHGLGHSSTAWLRTIPAFAQTYRVLAPDMPGYGRSSGPDVACDPPYFGRFIVDFISALGLGRVDAVGNSLGGLAIVLAALEMPSAFRKVVIVDPVGFTAAPAPPLDNAMLAVIGLWTSLPRTRAMIRAGYAAGFYDETRLDEATVDEIDARATSEPTKRAARRSLREVFHFSKNLERFHARLARFEPPVLVVWGKNDAVLPYKDAEVARRALPAARIEVLEDCGHFPHIEQAATFCALVTDFLNAA